MRVLKDVGHRVLRTYNEARARPATDEEFRVSAPTRPCSHWKSRVVIEITHATYGVGDEPLEAVVSIRPAAGNVIAFETYKGLAGEDERRRARHWPKRSGDQREDAPMSGGSVFDDDASRKLGAAYLTPDVVAQRCETLRALALQPGERVLDIGTAPACSSSRWRRRSARPVT